MQRITVLEIKQMLDTLPDAMQVEFVPISAAWTGTMDPLRFEDMHFYDKGCRKPVLPSEPGAVLQVFISEQKGFKEKQMEEEEEQEQQQKRCLDCGAPRMHCQCPDGPTLSLGDSVSEIARIGGTDL